MDEVDLLNLVKNWFSFSFKIKISTLKSLLSNKEIESSSQIEKIRKEIEAENKKLKHELVALQEDYQEKLQMAELKKDDDIKKLIETLNAQNEVQLNQFK